VSFSAPLARVPRAPEEQRRDTPTVEVFLPSAITTPSPFVLETTYELDEGTPRRPLAMGEVQKPLLKMAFIWRN